MLWPEIAPTGEGRNAFGFKGQDTDKAQTSKVGGKTHLCREYLAHFRLRTPYTACDSDLNLRKLGEGIIMGGAVIGSDELIEGMLRDTMLYIGAIMAPFDAWLTLMSLETLPLRMAKHCSNSEEVVAFLAQHPKVKGINYPSLPHHPQRELARQQMPNGYGALLSFVVDGGLDGVTRVMEACQMITIIPSFGASRTIAMHPASHSHFGMTPEEREAAGVFDGLIRLSVGLEDAKDIIADLEQALGKL